MAHLGAPGGEACHRLRVRSRAGLGGDTRASVVTARPRAPGQGAPHGPPIPGPRTTSRSAARAAPVTAFAAAAAALEPGRGKVVRAGAVRELPVTDQAVLFINAYSVQFPPPRPRHRRRDLFLDGSAPAAPAARHGARCRPALPSAVSCRFPADRLSTDETAAARQTPPPASPAARPGPGATRRQAARTGHRSATTRRSSRAEFVAAQTRRGVEVHVSGPRARTHARGCPQNRQWSRQIPAPKGAPSYTRAWTRVPRPAWLPGSMARTWRTSAPAWQASPACQLPFLPPARRPGGGAPYPVGHRGQRHLGCPAAWRRAGLAGDRDIPG